MNVSKLTHSFAIGYGILVKGASYLASPLLLVVRLFWGWQFFVAGKGKLSDLAWFRDNVLVPLHIPFPGFNAVLVGTTECVGGLFLLLGLASRLTTIPLIFTLVVAYLTAESESLKVIFSDPDKFTGATPFLFLFACVLVFVSGPGVFSIDWLIANFAGSKTENPLAPASSKI